MKTAILFMVLTALVATSLALPVDNIEQYQSELESIWNPTNERNEDGSVRVKRLTCDLLSFQSKWVTPNHAACAAHCLALFRGYKGGYCKGTVCHCRK